MSAVLRLRPLLLLAFAAALTLAAASARADRTITCSSVDDRHVTCDVDTRGGVSLQTQLSKSPCRYNQTWGYDRRGIWVTSGCRATFTVGDPGWSDGSSGGWSGGGNVVRCESQRGRRQHCPANTRRGVRLTRQLSDSPCRYDETWGYDRDGIWVTDGCRAEFTSGRDDWGGGGGNGGGSGDLITCASEGGRRQYCRANTRGGVSLDDQLSKSPCRYNQTWGYDSGGVWVDDGCRASFRLGKTGSNKKDDDHTAEVVGGALLVGALAAVIAESGDQARDKTATELCQKEVQYRLQSAEGAGAVRFDSADVRKEERPIRVVVGSGDSGGPGLFSYECRIDMEEKRVVSARYDLR